MLKRNISLFAGISIAISMVIGSGLFGLPGLAVESTDPITALCGWLLLVAMMPAMIHIFSFLGQKHPSSEGIALYASIGFGAWSKNGILLLTCGTLAIGMPAFFMVGGSYIATLFGINSTQWTIPCAIGLACVTTSINLLGVKKLGWINKAAVLLVLCTITYISIQALPHAVATVTAINFDQLPPLKINSIWLAASIVFWAFQGWENLTFGFDEIENPHRNIPLIFWISFFFVSIIYVILAFSASAMAITGVDVHGLSGLAAMLPTNVLGKILLIVMIIILIANANSWVFGSSRAFLSGAKVGVLPKALVYVNSKGTPITSLVAALILYIVIMICMWIFRIETKYAFLMTTQGFILLYGGAILAFIRQTQGFASRVIAGVAGISWAFLMQGFGLMILYPLILLILGTLIGAKGKPSFATTTPQ
jgi:amino acid transporter